MDKCVDCNKSHEVSKSRYKCSGKLCQAWTHKQCSDKRQFSKEGYWYCKNHIIDIPLSDRKTNDDEEVSSEYDEDQPKDPKVDNKVNETDKKEDEKIVEEDSSDQFTSLNPNVTKRKDKKKIVPFDNGDDYNPFANFNCVDCNEKFTKELPGALCTECRSTYHLICLNDSELEDVKNNKFTCQHCIENQIRINNLSNDKKDKNKVQNKDNKKFTSSTPKIVDLKSKTKFSKRNQIIESESSLSLTSTDSFSSSDTDDSKNIKQKYNKLKRLMKQRKSKRHSKKSQSRFSSSDESELKVTQSDAMIGIYRLTKEERDKAKYDKLPIVDNVDTKWAVFFDLFKQSRKMFSDSENVLRIQKSLKAKEILEIGGISLFDPRTYWEAIKLIDDRLSKSHNLLLRETNEIIKLKKLRNDVESKKIIEFINRIINYSHIVERYGKKKHKVDDRIISHIGNIMPYSLMNGWHKAKGKLEDKDKTIYIKDVANYLSKQVSTINSKMQSEELDPWKENTSKPPFKRNDFGYKRTYNTNAKSINNIESFNYCWLHKSKSHSPFDCTKLWELSGKEVSELARKNGICTFCGLKKHKDCHTTKLLNCKMENCNLKHHILFCYKRSGKINRNNYGNNKRNENNNKSNVRTNNSNRNPPNQPRLTANNNNSHHNDNNNEIPQSTDDTINVNNTINSEEEEVTIPPSNFYLNQPPASIKIKKNNQGRNRNSLISFCNENNQSHTIRCDFIQTHTSLNKVTRSAQCILGVIVIRFIENNENIAFLMDSGSTVSIIEESLANKLELKGIWSPLKINWSSEINRIDYGSRIVKVKVSSTSINSREYNLYLRTVKNLNIIDQAFDADEITELYPYLAPMHLTSYCKVYGILGIDNLWCFNQITTFKPNNWNSNEPYGIRCPLGDYVVGCFHQLSDIYNYLKNNPNNNSILNTIGNVFSTQLSLEEEKELANMEKIILGLEYNSFDENDNNSYEDSLALELLNLYVKRSDNNINFEAPLLWRTLDINLPTEESFKIAYKRLLIVEKNSLKNGRFNECVEQVDNLLRKKYAEIVPQNEINLKGGKIFYLPTFFIQPKNKRTRFIWDAATKVLGKSLNDYLLAGPNMYTNYLDIILQMREGKFIIKGDLQEMFHQVIMRKEDRDSLRFLFRKSPNDKIQILRMRVMIFGSKSSPTTSQFVKNKVAEPFAQSHPNAYNVIVNKTYVDDVITSIDDLQSGQILINDVRNILKTGGFNLVKLKSNCNDILDIVRKNLSPDDLKNEKLFSKDDTEKLLGYTINFHTDELSIALTLERIPEEILNCTNKPTKKQVLKLTMSIFDPIEIIEFLISKFKLIYNWLIKDNYEWNQIMSDDYFIIWKKCLESLKEITNIKIPRIYSHKLSDASIIQLVGFGDAGIEMLCAVIYLRLLDDERNQIDYKFLCSKSYTVPYRQSRTIPDLEVDIACKLSILMTKIEKALTIKIDEKINFTDNSAIKEWIVNGAKNPKIYVHNRLEKIKKFSKIEEWKWTPTHLQPADFGTKISSMPIISYHNDWFHPPLFQLPESNWPTIETNSINHSVSNTVNIPEEDISENLSFIHNFSCFDRLITGLSKALEWKHRVEIIKINRQIKAINSVRFTRRNYNKNRMILESLKEKKREVFKSIDMIRNGYKKHEASIIRIAQKESYKNEYNDLENGKEVNKKSLIYKLLPYLDDNGVMRSRTRVSNTPENREKFGNDRINSIILHRESHLTRLIVMKEHNKLIHINEKTVVINLLQRFFINKIRQTVKNIIKMNCLECRINHAKPIAPLMGDIPYSRLAIFKNTFTYAMADFLGPLSVKISKYKCDKRYVLVYTCLTTRALHLELVESLEADALLRALSNVFNTRGAPIKIYSDNGTNFTGGNNIMQECHESWNKKLLRRGIIIEPIEWCFSPPKAPHMNGAVERMVGLVKKAMKGIKKYIDGSHTIYDDFGMKSVLCEVANMINSRPIEILPPDENQHTYLTPNLFLIGRQNAQSLPIDFDPPRTLTQQWRDIKMISNIIWDKWLKSFFPIMRQREKWIDRVNPLKVDDVVITADPSVPNSWRKGIITKIIMGSQGQVRQVEVRFGKHKICNSRNSYKNMNKKQIMKALKSEPDTKVLRPATMVAKINLD